ncbi:MAG: linoleoyl-CoA desaturase [Crocinitomicaceae bacterium]|jgi:linoleoyl-CoA desaturase
MEIKTLPKFEGPKPKDFFRTLNSRVNNYFKQSGKKKTGDCNLYIKALIMFTIYFGSYVLLFIFQFPFWCYLLLAIIMGVGKAGVGMNVMHDANHGAFSSKKWVNKLMGASIYILAGNVYNWKVQHNLLHHTYTNIPGHDEDLDAGRVIRLTKYAKWHQLHRFQHYYSIFLYGLLTFNWVITADFKQTKKYLRRGLVYGNDTLPTKTQQWSSLIFTKVLYITIFLVIPTVFSEFVFWQVFIAYFLMHYVAGMILSVVFQLAHIGEDAHIVLPESDGKMNTITAIHQLRTTINFAMDNRIVNWFTGGLNYQIEHHIFPGMSHTHYVRISKIVRETAREFNLPYNSYLTLGKAIWGHIKHLKNIRNQRLSTT